MNITGHGIHILPGEWTAGTWSMAFGAEERLLSLCDDLTCGPLRAFDSLSEWTSLRQGFWNAVSPQWAEEIFRNSYDHTIDVDLPRSSSRLRDAPAIYLWAGNNLHDQLFVLFAVHLIERAGADPAKIHLLPFEVRPHHNGRFISVASCSVEELKQHPEPVQVSAGYLTACRAAWDAITAETPTALLDYVGGDHAPLTDTLAQLLRRYPKRESGLSLWDRMLLERVGTSGPDAARVIAEVLCDTWENGDSVGDEYLYYRLKQMASSGNPKPLAVLHGSPETYRGTTATLTDFGRDVLEGRASAYPTNPIDEWIGGVHLSSKEDKVWMYEGNTLRKFRGT